MSTEGPKEPFRSLKIRPCQTQCRRRLPAVSASSQEVDMGPGCPAQLADSASSFVRTPPPSSSSARRPTRSASASLRQAARIPHEQLLHCRHSRSPNCIGYTGGWNCSCRATVGFLERTGQSALSRKGTRRPRHCEAPFSFRRLRSAELLRQMLCRARSQRFHGLVYS
jgi:hypothetical protein